MPQQDTAGAPASQGSRIGLFDIVRGFSVVSMVLFHLCYDLRYIYGLDMPWFAQPLMGVWRCSISWTFLFVAGCMCPLSRSNLKRAASYGAVALAIWAVTTLAAVDTPISFGIIYCMAACTFVTWLLQGAHALPRGPVAAAVLFVGFLALQDVSKGTVGLMGVSVELPRALYETETLAWLGFPGPGFASGDYYPLLPYLLLYLTGAAAGASWHEKGYPSWARTARCAPLEWVGRHALAVYAAHQPILLVLGALVAQVVAGRGL